MKPYWIGCSEGFRAEGVRLKVEEEWKIVESISPKHKSYGYRFYPDKIKGEGFFIAVMQKLDGDEFAAPKPGRSAMEKLSKVDDPIVRPWLKEDVDLILFKQKEDIIALPANLQKEIPVLQSALYIKKAGVTVGKMAGKDLIPDHQLAVSEIISKNIVRIELNKQEAIQYLRKEEMKIDTAHRGWALVCYEGHNLGWIKVLPNRFNNYYPKEWRIIKTSA